LKNIYGAQFPLKHNVLVRMSVNLIKPVKCIYLITCNKRNLSELQ